MARGGAGAGPAAGCTRTCGQVQLLSMPPSSPPREGGVAIPMRCIWKKKRNMIGSGFPELFLFQIGLPIEVGSRVGLFSDYERRSWGGCCPRKRGAQSSSQWECTGKSVYP